MLESTEQPQVEQLLAKVETLSPQSQTQIAIEIKPETETEIETLATEGSDQARYVVRLPVFEGPLDLLLHLIEKRQMEITTISLLAVTDQYIEYLRQWQDHPEGMPLANMAAFVSIATRLLYIKSQSLLPHTTK